MFFQSVNICQSHQIVCTHSPDFQPNFVRMDEKRKKYGEQSQNIFAKRQRQLRFVVAGFLESIQLTYIKQI